MADLKEWYNADGLRVPFAGWAAQKRVRKNVFVEVRTEGNYREAICHFDLTLIPTTTVSYTTDRDNDGTVDGFNSGDVAIPNGAVIESVKMYSTETAVGGTDVEVGGYTEAGVVVDRDGLITAANGIIADMAAGEVIFGTGADVADATGENKHAGTAPYYIGIYANGTYTAGKGKIVVRWVDPAS